MDELLGFDPTDPDDEAGEQAAPICSCGVTAIPSESASLADPAFVCENPDCEAFGTTIG